MSEDELRKLLADVVRVKAKAEAALERTSKRLRDSRRRIKDRPRDRER